MKVVSVTVELEGGEATLRPPARVIQLLGLRPDDHVEARLSQEGRTFESTVRIGSGGQLHGLEVLAKMAGPVLLTLWAIEGREVEAQVAEDHSYTSLTDSLYKLARELDPGRTGVSVRDLRDAAVARGLLGGKTDPYRHIYSLLGYAKDRFVRSGRATFTWQEPDLDARQGIGGKQLVQVVLAWAKAHDPDNQGVHYQEVAAGLEAQGTPVKGPDRGRTLYANLIGPTGSRVFERSGAGVFKRKPERSEG